MIKKGIIYMGTTALFLLTAVNSNATLTTIGTATYEGNEYKLIWDDDNNGNSVVWLDYSHMQVNWEAQRAWAVGLGGQLNYNINTAYTVNWDDNTWRLGTSVDGYIDWNTPEGYDGTTLEGYKITTSEIGHLYYEELIWLFMST